MANDSGLKILKNTHVPHSPLNSNGAPTKYKIFTVSKTKQKKVATLLFFL